jgi:hypothetical protein
LNTSSSSKHYKPDNVKSINRNIAEGLMRVWKP